jgi:uncharacterized protein with HEPN domain
MQREAKAYLWDIARAAESIQRFVAGKGLDDYVGDELLRAAVERKFGIIGEAISSLLRLFPEMRSRISHPSEIVGFRSQIIHGYATVRDDIVWEIVHSYLPVLHREVSALLEEPATPAPLDGH